MIDELGLFETLLVIRGRAVQVEEHLARMLASARALSFPPPDADTFRRAVARAAKRIDALDEAALRCVWAATNGKNWRLTSSAGPIPDTTLRRRKNGRAITLAHGRALPEHKLTAYAASTIGLREAIAKNADEGLFLDREGRVLEGTATNIFAVDGDTLITAGDGILPGIVRAWVLANAKNVIERAPTIDELRAGSFFTSSLTTIAPIRAIDGKPCNVARVVTELRRMYRAACSRMRTAASTCC